MSQIPSQMDIVERLKQAWEASGGRDTDARDARDEIISLRLTQMEKEAFVAAEVGENLRIFELLGLTSEEAFGERSSTQAIADEIVELIRRNNNQAKTIHDHQMACKEAGTDPTEGCVACIQQLRSRLDEVTRESEDLHDQIRRLTRDRTYAPGQLPTPVAAAEALFKPTDPTDPAYQKLIAAFDDRDDYWRRDIAALRLSNERMEKALKQIAIDPPVSESPTIESILNRAQRIAKEALKTRQRAGVR